VSTYEIGMLAPWTAGRPGDTIACGRPDEEATKMWKLAYPVALAAVVIAVGVGGTATASSTSRSNSVAQREADMYEIDQIEVKFHRATSHHDINLMMSLWAPGAVFNIDQKTLVGKAQIRHWFLTENKAFRANPRWESDTPSYKIRTTLSGDKATMYFECHYIDTKTSTVVAEAGVTHTLQRIDGRWLITNSAGSTATLKP
jgi:ketosteroid isomerase-like protein